MATVVPRSGAMAPAGAYQRGAETQGDAAAVGLALIGPAVDALALAPDGAPVWLADFGAADGSNSLTPISVALQSIRRWAPRRPVVVVHADIVGNDFSALAATVTDSPRAYVRSDAGVLPVMAARSLFAPVLPPDSLAFGWSASTVHWLSQAPGPVADSFFVQMSHDDAAKLAYAGRSAADWHAFLLARGDELLPGASVVVVDVLMGDDGSMGAESLFGTVDAALNRCRDTGTLTAQEYADIVYPTWFRTVDDIRAPFTPEFEGNGGRRLALRDLMTAHLPDPFADRLDRPAAYAQSQVDFLKGFLQPSFAAALAPERVGVLESVWAVVAEQVTADPAAVSPDYRLVAFTVVRTS